MQRLNCALLTYAWGKYGSSSKAALYKQSHDSTFKLNETQTYAELWMGTHKNGPSKLIINDDDDDNNFVNLNDNYDLPFLFKVLSARQALSIQAHPNKQLAAELHSKDPKNYPDSNHKPEMLIAINRFEGLCGFRPSNEIAYYLKNIPQLREMCGKENSDRFLNEFNKKSSNLEINLKECFNELMKQDENFIRNQVESLLNSIKLNEIKLNDNIDDLFIRLNEQYPNDVGLFSIFLLNRFILEPLESVYLKANVPHAYIYGDAIECMACSDNVVRAGLTPKFKDVNTLVSMLDYTMNSIDTNRVYSKELSNGVFEYKPIDCNDFSVHCIQIKHENISLKALKSPSILIIIENNSQIIATVKSNDTKIVLKQGFVYFIHPNEEISLEIVSIDDSFETNFLAYRAFSYL